MARGWLVKPLARSKDRCQLMRKTYIIQRLPTVALVTTQFRLADLVVGLAPTPLSFVVCVYEAAYVDFTRAAICLFRQ